MGFPDAGHGGRRGPTCPLPEGRRIPGRDLWTDIFLGCRPARPVGEHARVAQEASAGRLMVKSNTTGRKTIKYRDVDYETAKKEVMEYFQERGAAYPSDIEEDLELDYKLICQIVEELKREGRLEVL